MISVPRFGLIVCITALPLAAQVIQKSWDTGVPLTAEGKAVRALKLTLPPGGAIGSLIGAGFDQLDNYPKEWGQGAKGYSHRFVSLYARRATDNALSLGLSVAMKTEPRYDRCDCKGFTPRPGHALLRTVWARKDNGGEIINVPLLAGFVGAAAIANQWNPERIRTGRTIARAAGIDIGGETAQFVLTEFWPEIRKKLPFVKK